ncbi:MAG: hypothetical protein J3K34DRAFT_432297 [Monoraphidium minutum]|nr:MAG: hypothetical protein J3K34DRAFT_432297 [Monoraphidium minutum]
MRPRSGLKPRWGGLQRRAPGDATTDRIPARGGRPGARRTRRARGTGRGGAPQARPTVLQFTRRRGGGRHRAAAARGAGRRAGRAMRARPAPHRAKRALRAPKPAPRRARASFTAVLRATWERGGGGHRAPRRGAARRAGLGAPCRRGRQQSLPHTCITAARRTRNAKHPAPKSVGAPRRAERQVRKGCRGRREQARRRKPPTKQSDQ